MTTKTKSIRPRKTQHEASDGTAKRREVVRDMENMKLLGEIITWQVGEGPHEYKSIVQALENAGLDKEVARELLPRHAFTRAAKKLEEKVLDPIGKDSDWVSYQITKRFLEQDEWKYAKEAWVRLDTVLGKVTGSDPGITKFIQEQLDRAIETRTASDVTKIIQKLFEKEGDLIPLRDQGGVYFVPDLYSGFTKKVKEFVAGLGGRVGSFPVPAGTQDGDKSVQGAVKDHLATLIKEHEEAVGKFGLDTRHDTLERAAEKIKQTRVKVEAYASYLQDKAQEMLDSVGEANRKLTERVQELTTQKSQMSPEELSQHTGGNRANLTWGEQTYSATAVIRWMGRNGWGFGDARRVMDHYTGKGHIADGTIRAQLLGGRDGDNPRGEPAALTEEQAAELQAKREELRAAAMAAGTK